MYVCIYKIICVQVKYEAIRYKKLVYVVNEIIIKKIVLAVEILWTSKCDIKPEKCKKKFTICLP